MLLSRLAGAHLHGDNGAEDVTIEMVEQRQLNVHADRRVDGRHAERKVVDGGLEGVQRARRADQMVAGVVVLGGQRVGHPRVADLGVDDRPQSGGGVRRSEVDLHVGGGALGDDAR